LAEAEGREDLYGIVCTRTEDLDRKVVLHDAVYALISLVCTGYAMIMVQHMDNDIKSQNAGKCTIHPCGSISLVSALVLWLNGCVDFARVEFG
jgi:hypothetical protein